MMGSLQQSVWTKALNFPANGCGSYGFIPQVKLNNVKPCKAFSVEGSLVSGKPSTLSVPEIGGNYTM